MFGDRDSGAYLLRFAWTKITRHTLVKGLASPMTAHLPIRRVNDQSESDTHLPICTHLPILPSDN